MKTLEHSPLPWHQGGPRNAAEEIQFEIDGVNKDAERRRLYAQEFDDEGEPDVVLVARFERPEDAALVERVLADHYTTQATIAELVAVIVAGTQTVAPFRSAATAFWSKKAAETLDRLGLLPKPKPEEKNHEKP